MRAMVPRMASSLAMRGAVVVDANVAIAIACKETGRAVVATQFLSQQLRAGYRLFAPGAIVVETLFVLCRKQASGVLSPSDYAAAVNRFDRFVQRVLPPPSGDNSLVLRGEQIVATYGCSRSADGIYIALAEALSVQYPTVLAIFDADMPKQAAKNAASVTIRVL